MQNSECRFHNLQHKEYEQRWQKKFHKNVKTNIFYNIKQARKS